MYALTFHLIVLVTSIIGLFLFKKWFLPPLVTLVISFGLMIFMNIPLINWVVVYTVIVLVVSLGIQFLKKK
ncbi:DUF2651 family protein [Alkalihalobacterium elongatum]|uniref:DUF2651 family protein n=1 Tax=Alkalihalobacterium elongatum TaxID=2675466 RepID=UPI001C1F3E16|nr:DUF2651 family protein [Alkalihalobacterium elongatum]